MSDEPREPTDLAAQDEILQVMYWLRGERLAEDVAAGDLVRFSGAAEPQIVRILHRLCGLGWLRQLPTGDGSRFALTVDGAREAGRRFADEFADMTKPGHGECGDPECDCHTTGHVEDCRHR